MEKNVKVLASFSIVFVLIITGLIFSNYFTQADAPPPTENEIKDDKNHDETNGEKGNQGENNNKEKNDKSKDNEDKNKDKNKDKNNDDKDKLNFEYPDAVRGIYLTGHSAGHPTRFDDLIKLINNTDLNSMVIDIKDDHGNITFKLDDSLFKDYSRNYIEDPKEVLKTLEKHEIYPIARIVVFKDSVYSKDNPEKAFLNPDGSIWKNDRGEAYINPFLEENWEYNLQIAKKAAEMGFQDIQFDYVRFPEGFEHREERLEYSFGSYTKEKLMPRLQEEWDKEQEKKLEKAEEKIKEVEKEENKNNEPENKNEEEKENNLKPPEYSYGLARTQAITDFVEYAYEELEPYDVDVSVDIFGYTAVDMKAHGIGQNFLEISSNVDVISSMIYPSHWHSGYFGIQHPDKEPYNLVDEYATRENKILKQLDDPPVSRPWIQDFTASWLRSGTYISYGKEEVEAQIKALNKNNIKEFLIWDSTNNYTQGVDYTPLSND